MSDFSFDEAAFDELVRDPAGPIGQDLERRGVEVETAAKRLLSLPGSGRVYTTGFFTDAEGRVHPVGKRVPHQASAPGEPPAVDTGLLRASVRHELVEEDEGLAVYVGSDLKISEYLSLGTRRMAPRPFLEPALGAAAE